MELYLPSSYAAADLFVLLSWSCNLYTTCTSLSPQFVSSDSWPVLTAILATLLDLLLSPSTRSKPTIQNSARARTRSALRSAPQHLQSLISTLLTHAKSSQTPLIYIPLLGTAFDVTIRLKNVKHDSFKQIPPSLKVSLTSPLFDIDFPRCDLAQDGIINLYTTLVLMSKTAVPVHVSVRLFTNTPHPTHDIPRTHCLILYVLPSALTT